MLSHYDKAIEYYEESLVIKRELSDRTGEANTVTNLGLTNDHLGRYEDAIEDYQQARTIMQEVGDRKGEEGVLTNLGLANRRPARYFFHLQCPHTAEAVFAVPGVTA